MQLRALHTAGIEEVQRLMAKGQGAVGIGSHLGSVDALRLLVRSIVEPVDFLVQRPEEGRALDIPPCGPAPR